MPIPDSATIDENGVVWGLRNYVQGDAIPTGSLLFEVQQPWEELYGFLVDLFQQWPDWYPDSQGRLPEEQGMYVNSWYRTPARQAAIPTGAAKISLHELGLAFDILHDDGAPAYAAMGDFADNWWGGPTGGGPQSAQAGRVDGYWTADYSEKQLHFHIQRWTGRTSDWYAWVNWAANVGFV